MKFCTPSKNYFYAYINSYQSLKKSVLHFHLIGKMMIFPPDYLPFLHDQAIAFVILQSRVVCHVLLVTSAFVTVTSRDTRHGRRSA